MKVKSFIKETIARIEGDTKTVISEQNLRRVDTGIDGQLAALKGSKIDAENKVYDAKENLAKTKHPDYKITDITSYFRNVKDAQQQLSSAENALQDINDSIDYYVSFQKEINKEVEVA